MNKLASLLLIIGMMMAVAPVTLGQEANPTIECTSEIGCRVLLDVVELPILIAQADTLSGRELKEAMKSFRKEFTGGMQPKYVLSPTEEDDITLLFVQEDEDEKILGLILYSREWGWLQADTDQQDEADQQADTDQQDEADQQAEPTQQQRLQEIFSMASTIKHMFEVSDSQHLR